MLHPSKWQPVARHAAVFAITCAAIAFSGLLALALEPSYFLPLTAAVAACSWFFGRAGGVHATAVGTIMADFFLLKPRYSFVINDRSAVAGLLIFVAIALLITWLVSSLRTSQDLQTSILEGMSDALIVLDRHGSIVYLNPAAEALSGQGLEGVRNRPFLEAFPLRDERTGEKRPEPVSRIPAGSSPFQSGTHTVLKAKDGTEYSVEESTSPIGEKGAIVVLRNVTRRRQMQDQLTQSQKMEAIARLAGGVAGDFNNLLTVITGFGELLTSEIAPGNPLRRFAEEILTAADRAAGLTRQLLALGRGQSVPARPYDLNALVVNLKTMVSRVLGPTIEVVVLAESRSSRIKTDPGQIEQIAANLAMNARDAMPNGGRFVVGTSDIETLADTPGRLPDLPPGQYVMLSVSDTGIGMDAETRARLFEPFFTTKEQAPGLGLSIVYGIVKQHGGHISVYSQPGAGSIFEIYFPRAKDVPAVVTAPRPRGPRGSETILIADDEEAVRKLVHAVLATSGYTVLEASDGAEALDLFEQHGERVDMVLTDVVMPRMDGYELGERVRQIDPRKKILFMSGFPEPHGSGDSGGSRPFLNKPFTPEALLKHVRETLDARREPS